MGQAEWATVPISTRDVDGPVFFTEHEWNTIEAATARIIPTDHHPGAREAKVVRFIDRMLAGTQFIFPAADGNGFLRMEGRDETAWQERIKQRREFYREGVVELDRLAKERADVEFLGLSEEDQDAVLETLAGATKPAAFSLEHSEAGLYIWATEGRDAWETVGRFAELGILVAPGHFYGPAGAQHVRVGLTASDEQIAKAAQRLAELGSGVL